jgi:LPXTG-motif cell wall-anchored protein
MSPSTVQLIAGLLCVALIGIIILRRRAKKKQTDDEF